MSTYLYLGPSRPVQAIKAKKAHLNEHCLFLSIYAHFRTNTVIGRLGFFVERRRRRSRRGRGRGRRMIYRKWSLLTGPAVLFGGVAGALLAVNFVFKQDPFGKPPEKKQGSSSK